MPVIELVAMVAVMAYVSARVQRAAGSPDFGRTLKLRAILGAKRAAQWQANVWQNIAGDLGTAYNRAK